MELASGKVNEFFTPEGKGENKYYVEGFNADSTIGTNNVFIFAQRIPTGATILDIGCGQGNFGAKLKEKECIIYGFEMDHEAAACAIRTGNYADVFVGDITDTKSPEFERFLNSVPPVDVVILSDVLEHLADPTSALSQCANFLKENGIILISVPNIAHMDIMLNLINGKFNYSTMGILDNTHLKFFTKSSFYQWIKQINTTFKSLKFDCEYLGATFYTSDFMNQIKQQYNELYGVLEYCEDYNGLQILFQLTKLPLQTEPSYLNMISDESERDVVATLGNALKGKLEDCDTSKLVNGERLWYDMVIKDRDNTIQKLEEEINCDQMHSKEMQEEVEKRDTYIKELEGKIYEYNDLASKKDSYIRELESNLKWHADRIQEVEKGLKWYQEQDQLKDQETTQNKTNNDIIKELEIKIYEYNDLASKKDSYIRELESNLKWHVDRIEEVEKGLKWHQAQDQQKDQEIEQIKINSDKLLEKNKQEVILLRQIIFDIENSVSWKITKCLRKK